MTIEFLFYLSFDYFVPFRFYLGSVFCSWAILFYFTQSKIDTYLMKARKKVPVWCRNKNSLQTFFFCRNGYLGTQKNNSGRLLGVNNALVACLRRRHLVLPCPRRSRTDEPLLCPCDHCRASPNAVTRSYVARYATSSSRATTVTSVRVTASGCY